MGLDLTLLPYHNEYIDFSNTVLDLHKNSELQDKIETLPMLDVSNEFYSHMSRDEKHESHFGLTIEDNYGDRVKYTTVKELLKIKDFVDSQESFKNKAAWAYLNELPSNTKVALYWH